MATYGDERLPGRFWSKVQPDPESGCWLWTAATIRDGYGSFWLHRSRSDLAHRVSYTVLVGAIPDGLQIDHLCRVRHCVNPAHLEPVTGRENFLRGEMPNAVAHREGRCRRGHPLIEGNTIPLQSGGVCCRKCFNRARARRQRENYAALKDAGFTPKEAERLKSRSLERVLAEREAS